MHLENTIKTTTRCHSILVGMAKIKKKKNHSWSEQANKGESAKTEGINCIKE